LISFDAAASRDGGARVADPYLYIQSTGSQNHESIPSTTVVGLRRRFVGALIAGLCAYLAGLWNAGMQLNEKGYYFTVLVFGLYAAISLQKSVRDRVEGIPVTTIYYGLSWTSLTLAVMLLVVGLINATLALSEKGFYAMSFVLALFGAIAVQKNTRDIQAAPRSSPGMESN
jgi:uncharacterized membrane protein YiaA